MSEPAIITPNITGIECRFAFYCPPNDKHYPHDLHFVKERIHYADGTSKPNIRLIKDYQRDFYVTNKGARNHQQKKEWEYLSNLTRFTCTQSQLTRRVASALGQPWFQGSLRDLAASPYLYGTDVSSTSLIKQSYKEKWDIQTPYSISVFDTETDVVYGHGQIQMATLSCKETVVTAVQKSFVKAYNDPIARIHELVQIHLGEIFAQRKIQLQVVLVDDEIGVVKTCMEMAHRLQPDYVSCWNMLFDIKKVIEACERAQTDPADVLCDPKVPPMYRHFKLKEGSAKKITQSGKVQNFKPAARWHSVSAPASFTWVDSMCAFKAVRAGEPDQPSYSLDYLLKQELGENFGKLKFKEADHLVGGSLDWHKFMQANYPLEYVVYNIYDCVGVEMFDEKMLDLQLTLPMFANSTDIGRFNSQPKRTIDELHFFVQKLDPPRIMGTTGPEMTTDLDPFVTKAKGWITMLPSHLVADNGLRLIAENPLLPTNVRIHVADKRRTPCRHRSHRRVIFDCKISN